MRKIGGLLLIVGLVILMGWGIYWFFRLAFLEMPLPVKVAIAAIAVGLAILRVGSDGVYPLSGHSLTGRGSPST